MIEKLHKNAFVEKYPSGHIKNNCQICQKYISNTIFTFENIYIDVSGQILHIVYMS